MESLSHYMSRAAKGDLERLRADVGKHPELLRVVMEGHRRTLVWEAVRFGRRDVFDWLLEQGAVWDVAGRYHAEVEVLLTPYVIALARTRRSGFAECLAERGAEVDPWGAAYLGDVTRLARFVDADDGLVSRPHPDDDIWAMTPLHYAFAGKKLEAVTWLMAREAPVLAFGSHFVGRAIEHGWDELVERLFDMGVPDRSIPLEVALGRPDLLQRLLAAGFDLDACDTADAWPPLAYHCRGDRGGRIAVIRTLIDHGAGVSVAGPLGKTPLHCAAKAGFTEIVELLLSRGADPTLCLDDGATPLDLAVAAGRKEVAAVLRAHRARS